VEGLSLLAPPARPPSPFDRLRARTLLALFLLTSLAIIVVVSLTSPRGSPDPDERLIGILTMLGMIGVLLLYAKRAGHDWRPLYGPPGEREQLPLLTVIVPVILLTFAAAYAVFVPLSYVWPRFVERHLLAPRAFFDVTTFPQWLALFVAACVIAPIAEETIFRGILMHRWARRWGTPTGVIASSVLFAVMHQEWLGKIVFGVAMCALYLRTRRLWVPIAAHALNNALIVLPLLPDVFAPHEERTETLGDFRAHWWIGALTLAAGLVLLRAYVQLLWPNGRVRAVLTGPVPYEAAESTVALTLPLAN
jgi:membrane protease YdiL (CAAX protease family)